MKDNIYGVTHEHYITIARCIPDSKKRGATNYDTYSGLDGPYNSLWVGIASTILDETSTALGAWAAP